MEEKERTKEDYKKYYDQLYYIAHGAYGEIFKGKEKGKEELKAIKVINLNNLKEKLKSEHEDKESLLNHLNICREGYINEFEIMKTCSKNNINSVECYEYFDNKDNFIIIMELCDGNLLDLFNKKKENDKGLNIEELLKIMKQLNNAFKIMKENNIIHRDLKLENILIKYNDEDHKNYTIKLADYGCSKRLDSLLENYCSTYIGTPIYMAPEILNEDKYNFKSDLWSIGIIIYKLFFDKFLFYGERIAVKNKINNFYNKSIKTGNTKLDDLLQNLLEKDPEKRLDWDTYLNHPFFKDNNLIIINLIYETEKKGIKNIFGEKFVLNNHNNIELIINGENCDLIKKFELKKGINNIEMIIKNKINNLEYMFYECSSLKNIDDLKNLDVKGIKNFSHIFSGCKSLSDIKSLENWDVSNGINFSNMFCGCKLISDINPLKEWNISKAQNFSWMFRLCQSISDLKSLQNWDVSNVNNFTGIFSECTKLSDIKSLQNWNISNGKDFSWMFSGCKSLSDIIPLKNWKLSKGNDFSCMFKGCKILSNLSPIEKWDVSNGNDFSYMFNECIKLSDLSPIEKWNVSNGNNFSYMFSLCKSLSDLKPLENWKVSNGDNFSYMFYGCDLLSDINPLKNWEVFNGSNFLHMFSECKNLLDIKPLKNWNISESYFDDLLE